MQQYELMVLLKPDYDHANAETLGALIKKMVGVGAKAIKSTTVLGKKRLAYPIMKHEEGVYVLVTLDGTIKVATIEEQIRMDKDVLRYLLITK